MIILLVCGKNTTFAENKQYASISFPYTSYLGRYGTSPCLPEYNRDVILSIRHFIVENVRTARRFLKKVEPGDRDR